MDYACKDCGRQISRRAHRCTACAAAFRWRSPSAKRQRTHLKRCASKRRRTYAQLSLRHFNQGTGPRKYAQYWDGGVKSRILIYRWLWVRAHGEIPPGYVVHHIDGDAYNNELTNLQIMSEADHVSLHADVRRDRHTTELICAECGQNFRVLRHTAGSRKFCSKACYTKFHANSETHTCSVCGKPYARRFSRTVTAGKTGRFCSKRCYDAHRRTQTVSCACCGKAIPFHILGNINRRAWAKLLPKDRFFCSKKCFQSEVPFTT